MWLSQEDVTLFDAKISDIHINIDYTLERSDLSLFLIDYVETMQISLWETAFFEKVVADKGVHKNNKPDNELNF